MSFGSHTSRCIQVNVILVWRNIVDIVQPESVNCRAPCGWKYKHQQVSSYIQEARCSSTAPTRRQLALRNTSPAPADTFAHDGRARVLEPKRIRAAFPGSRRELSFTRDDERPALASWTQPSLGGTSHFGEVWSRGAQIKKHTWISFAAE